MLYLCQYLHKPDGKLFVKRIDILGLKRPLIHEYIILFHLKKSKGYEQEHCL